MTRGPGVALESRAPGAQPAPRQRLWLGSAGGRLLAVRMGIRDREGEPGVRDGVAIDELWPDPALGRVTLPDLPNRPVASSAARETRCWPAPPTRRGACNSMRAPSRPCPGGPRRSRGPRRDQRGRGVDPRVRRPAWSACGSTCPPERSSEPIAVEGTIEVVMGDEPGHRPHRPRAAAPAGRGGRGGWSAEAPPPVAGLPGVPVPISDGRAPLTFAEPGPERDPAAPHRGLLVRDDGAGRSWATRAPRAGGGPSTPRGTSPCRCGDPAEDGYAVQTRTFAPPP